MSHTFHVVVVGLGVMGSAAAWRLSQQGVSVLGLDSGAPINVLGSSYGSSRIFRQAYWEGLDYLPVLKQADEGWRELQAISGRSFLYASGGLFIGSRLSGVVSKSVATAKAGCIGYRRVTSSQVAKKFSAFHLSPEMEAVFEDGAYTIAADDAHLEMLNQAVVNGAQLRYGCRLDRIERIDGCLVLKLADGQTIQADRVILATGASLANSLIPDLVGIVRPVSVPVYWFNYKFGCERGFVNFPAFLYELHDGRLLYGTPQISQLEQGVKIGFHNHQQSGLNMDNQRFPVSEAYIEEVSECVASIFSGLSAQPYASKKCIYTLTPDDSFLLGESKELPGVYYISACSGHGFKFAPGIGNYMARAVQGESLSDMASIFSIARFDKSRLL